MKIKILIICDQNLLSEFIDVLLKSDPNVLVIDKLKTYNETEQVFKKIIPDVILIFLDPSSINNINAVKQLICKFPSLRIIALMRVIKKNIIIETLSAGAKGFISFASNSKELFFAINNVFFDSFYICQSASKELLNFGETKIQDDGLSQYTLNNREIQVLVLIADGMSSKQIAQELHIASNTVDVHRRNIMNKIGIHKSTDLTRYAIRNQLIQP